MSALNICITGNIASGKTTLAKLLSESFENACYIPEPFETNSFLPRYLRDPRRWAFTATLYYFWDYARIFHEKTIGQNYAYHFVDAGTWTNALLYTESMRGEQIITAEEHAFYQTLRGLIEQAFAIPQPNAFIFVNASAETCWRRMHARGWDYQVAAIRLVYIETLQRYLEEMKKIVAAENFPMLEMSSEGLDLESAAGKASASSRVKFFLDAHQRAHA